MKRIVFTVTNDLSYDQRMIRICTSLAAAGYHVTLVGFRRADSKPLSQQPFRQVRLPLLFRKGWLFYADYNFRLFWWLLFRRVDVVGAIDLDTILPCWLVSVLRRKERVYDAHELFCEMQEIVERPRVYRIWKWIERLTVPRFRYGYTVNQPIADEFNRLYQRQYEVVRNAPVLQETMIAEKKERFILYQGAVNEGRSFDTLIPAMKWVDARLIIAGDGNYMEKARELVAGNGLAEKVHFTGKLLPARLRELTQQAWVGVTLFEKTGLSNYYSLANRYFDYLHAGIPQLCVDYPVYRELNKTEPVALLTDDLSPEALAARLNQLLTDPVLYKTLQQNCLTVRRKLNWQEEEKVLIRFYHSILRP
ncbi:MAG: glycosyltransferase family 4 protein [Chitinophagaceae bacterium]